MSKSGIGPIGLCDSLSTAAACARDTLVIDLIWRGKYGVFGPKSSRPSLAGESVETVVNARIAASQLE